MTISRKEIKGMTICPARKAAALRMKHQILLRRFQQDPLRRTSREQPEINKILVIDLVQFLDKFKIFQIAVAPHADSNQCISRLNNIQRILGRINRLAGCVLRRLSRLRLRRNACLCLIPLVRYRLPDRGIFLMIRIYRKPSGIMAAAREMLLRQLPAQRFRRGTA